MSEKLEKYSDIGWEQVRDLYREPMQAEMRKLFDALTTDVPEAKAETPFEMDCDDYSVVVYCRPEGREPFTITLELVDSHGFDGVDGGYTFRVDIVEDGGLILGGFAPFNYTEQCWCKTLDDIRYRFELVKDGLPSTVEFVLELLAQ